MKWFNKWLMNRIRAAAASAAASEQENMKVSYHNSAASMMGNTAIAKSTLSQEFNSDGAIRFNVFNARGGRVVQINRYDKQRDREISGLYVITSEDDFGKEIDKIITMESLK